MFAIVIFLLFATAINSAFYTEPYYWRMYNGSIPHDAVGTEVANLFVGRVGVCIDKINYYPATLNSITKTATASVLGQKRVFDDEQTIMVLCTSEPKRLKWRYVNIAAVRENFLNKLVLAGHTGSLRRFVGKAFHDGEWKISMVYQQDHKWAGLWLWNKNDGSAIALKDFQILTFD